MRKYLTSAVLLLTSLMITTHAQDDRQQDNPTFKLQNFVQDVRNITFDGTPIVALKKLRVSCAQMKDVVDRYQKHVVSHLITRTSSSRSHLSVADDIAIIGLGRTKVQRDAAIHNAIATHFNANFFISVEMGCPLSPYLLTHPNLQQVNIADFGTYPDVFRQIQQLYVQIFKESMSEEITAQRHALDAFAAVFPVKDIYFPAANLKQSIFEYLEILGKSLPFKETYRTLLTDISFDQTSHIVVSDAQIQDEDIRTKLKTILVANPDHTVVLTVGNSANTVDAQGELSSPIMTDFVKNMGIKYLQLMNPRGNVKVIQEEFLDNCFVTSFDSRGLTSVQKIGLFFLRYCPLSNFDTRGFISVRSLGVTLFIRCRTLTRVAREKLHKACEDINAKKKIGLADLQLTFEKQ